MRNKLRMQAYYFRFNETGVKEIDEILSCIACAGKSAHHTRDWIDDDSRPHDKNCIGDTPIDWIQNAANRAADAILKGYVDRPEGAMAVMKGDDSSECKHENECAKAAWGYAHPIGKPNKCKHCGEFYK